MPAWAFAVLLPAGLIGLAALCLKARSALARAGDLPAGRRAMLLALTRNPGAANIE
jgi:hypothetical protein